MRNFKQILAAGAVLALTLTSSGVDARDRHGAASPIAPNASRYSAQYDGPAYGPGGGYGPYGGVYGPGYAPEAPYYPGYYRQRAYSRGARGSASYRGFRVKLGASARTAEGARELANARRQIAIVERAGLSGADLRAFRRQPIEFSRRGHFDNGGVFVGAQAGSRPVLLHEYMHVYHRDRLPGGFNNPAIEAFYQQALASGAYPPGSYMLSNVKEFFAMTASCFLNGTVARPPFNREAIRAAQPEYYAFLSRLFGRRA